MMFGGIFGIILIIIVMYLLFNKTSENNSYPSQKKSALDILDEEYARGNISEEEYLRKKKNLS
ncbi:hypothetical protein AX762_00075 [Alkalibacterium sp. 20]|nr:hypothetical protein AX762_00075 [Alkalibacterium sp. 20]